MNTGTKKRSPAPVYTCTDYAILNGVRMSRARWASYRFEFVHVLMSIREFIRSLSEGYNNALLLYDLAAR